MHPFSFMLLLQIFGTTSSSPILALASAEESKKEKIEAEQLENI